MRLFTIPVLNRILFLSGYFGGVRVSQPGSLFVRVAFGCGGQGFSMEPKAKPDPVPKQNLVVLRVMNIPQAYGVNPLFGGIFGRCVIFPQFLLANPGKNKKNDMDMRTNRLRFSVDFLGVVFVFRF